MLVLTRKEGETVLIGEAGEVEVTVVAIIGNRVRLGINAPAPVPIHRAEIHRRMAEHKAAVSAEQIQRLRTCT